MQIVGARLGAIRVSSRRRRRSGRVRAFASPDLGRWKLDPGPSYDRPHSLVDLTLDNGTRSRLETTGYKAG